MEITKDTTIMELRNKGHITPMVAARLYFADIKTLKELSRLTETQVMKFRGIGKSHIKPLRKLLAKAGLSFSTTEIDNKEALKALHALQEAIAHIQALNTTKQMTKVTKNIERRLLKAEQSLTDYIDNPPAL